MTKSVRSVFLVFTLHILKLKARYMKMQTFNVYLHGPGVWQLRKQQKNALLSRRCRLKNEFPSPRRAAVGNVRPGNFLNWTMHDMIYIWARVSRCRGIVLRQRLVVNCFADDALGCTDNFWKMSVNIDCVLCRGVNSIGRHLSTHLGEREHDFSSALQNNPSGYQREHDHYPIHDCSAVKRND